MTIEIPTWLLWTFGLLIGIPLLVGAMLLMWFGWVALNIYGRSR